MFVWFSVRRAETCSGEQNTFMSSGHDGLFAEPHLSGGASMKVRGNLICEDCRTWLQTRVGIYLLLDALLP